MFYDHDLGGAIERFDPPWWWLLLVGLMTAGAGATIVSIMSIMLFQGLAGGGPVPGTFMTAPVPRWAMFGLLMLFQAIGVVLAVDGVGMLLDGAIKWYDLSE